LATGTVSVLPPRPSLEAPAARPARDDGSRRKQAGLPPHVALALLQAGHRRYLAGSSGLADLSAERRQALTTSQRPFAIVLTDADSRLAPEHVFDVGLGDVAVVRVAACVLDDEVLGSIEHLLREFGPGLLVVMTPDRCGITEFVLHHADDPQLSPSLRTVAEWLQPSILTAQHEGATGDALVRAVAQLNVQRAVREARLRSPGLRLLEQRGQLGVLGALYRLADGEIEWLRDPAPRADERVGNESPPQLDPTADAAPPAPAVEAARHAPGPVATDHAPAHGSPAVTAPDEPASAHAATAGSGDSGSPLLIGLLVAVAGVFGAHALMQLSARRRPTPEV
jgi:carbonic anhydrase